MTVVVCIVLLILCAALLTWFLSPVGHRGYNAWFVFCGTTALAMLGGITFVVVHFVTKYW